MLSFDQWIEKYIDSEEVIEQREKGITYYSLYTLYKEAIAEAEFYGE